ncbi:Hypothetical predicted protein [Paramuricea clavata]|uniref:Uncharacterized protein n=1 Tax=Paramuricea clavata TaxID=317549 RepID=A0A6S7HU85_PARCT|nr:Hypothetical predicted protein [Paramuricea clavata]
MGILGYNEVTYYYHQRHFLFPSIVLYWQSYQKKILESQKGKEVVLAGDGQHDSMGHSAKKQKQQCIKKVRLKSLIWTALNMADFVFQEENPRFLQRNVEEEDVDIDHLAINLPVDDERTEEVLKSFIGNAVNLGTRKGQTWHRETWNFLILAWNPCIILTMLCNVVRRQLCDYFSHHGHVVLPAGDDASHIIIGHTKPIPTPTFIAGLRHAGVGFIRIINFGMKQPLNQLPPLPRDLLLCAATNSGYPENEYDISVSHRDPFLYLLKSFAPYPPGVTVHQYPILTPLSPLSSPVTTRQGSALFNTLNSIMNVLSVNHHHLVGGIRLEVRVRMNHVSDAVDHVLERQ